MPSVPLLELCWPKQWPTLSKSELIESGYAVYGANGKIGFTDSFTHEFPTLLIGCRGSCGTLHICEPRSYVNGNAMAIDQLANQRVDMKYLYFYLMRRGFADVITGTSQPQITREGLSKISVPLPEISEQCRLAAILDKADAIRRKRREALKLADEFLRATFLDLFGDPVSNPKGWPEVPVKELATVTTGNTPSREVSEFYGDHIEWIKSDNINTPNHYLTAATEGLSEKGFGVGRWVPAGATLITCIAGSPACIGNAALADRPVAFNQQINALTPKGDIEPEFLYALVLYSKRRIQAASTEGMKGMVSKGSLEQIHLISPDQALRRRFTTVFHKVMHSVERLGKSLHEAEALFQSLSHRAFQGTL